MKYKLYINIECYIFSAVVFQGLRCSACNNQLELPSIHFMCQHSYHQQ